jgi:hypothetical protein
LGNELWKLSNNCKHKHKPINLVVININQHVRFSV